MGQKNSEAFLAEENQKYNPIFKQREKRERHL